MRLLSYLLYLMFISSAVVAGCSSRTVNRSSHATDSVVISKMERTRDSLTELELKSIIEKLRVDYTFTLREKEITRDSAGNVTTHVNEMILQHSRENSRDSTHAHNMTTLHESAADSLQISVSNTEKVVVKESTHIHYFILLVIFIVLLIVFFAFGRRFRFF